MRALPQIEPETYKQHSAEIGDAIDLATLLLERRPFREAVIYDGIHGFEQPGQLGGAEKSCRSLEAAFLTDSNLVKRLKECLKGIENELDVDFAQNLGHLTSADLQRLRSQVKCLIGVRKWGKRYKPPMVLVARPLKELDAEHGSLDVEPLLDCEDPPNIKKQLDALKASYDSLWKVYLFLHPVFHDRLFKDTHNRVQKKLDEFAAKNTGIKWRNAVDFDQLLSEPLDNVSYFVQSGGQSYLESFLVPAEADRLVSILGKIVLQVFPQGADGKFPKMVGEFGKTLAKPTVAEKVHKQLSKGQTRERIERIVNIAPEKFKGLLDKQQTEKIVSLQAAQGIEKAWQDLVDKALDQALRETEPILTSAGFQPDLSPGR